MIIQSNIPIDNEKEFAKLLFAGNSYVSVYNDLVKEFMHFHCKKIQFARKMIYQISVCFTKTNSFQYHNFVKVLGLDLSTNKLYINSQVEQLPINTRKRYVGNAEYIIEEVLKDTDFTPHWHLFRPALCCRCGRPITEEESKAAAFVS